MRGLRVDVHAQNDTRIGTVVSRPMKIPVLIPPPSIYVREAGMPSKPLSNSELLKLVLPAPSAGRGGLWMAGDYEIN